MDEEIRRLAQRIKASGREEEFLLTLAAGSETCNLFEGYDLQRAAWWTEFGNDFFGRMLILQGSATPRFAIEHGRAAWWMPTPVASQKTFGKPEVTFTFPDLVVQEHATLHGLHVILGIRWIRFDRFKHPLPMMPQDVLKLTHTFGVT